MRKREDKEKPQSDATKPKRRNVKVSGPPGGEHRCSSAAVMRSVCEAGGRGRVGRPSGGRGPAAKAPSVFCCHGSTAAGGEDRYLPARRPCPR